MRLLRAAGLIASLCVASGAAPSVAAAQTCPEGHFEGEIGGASVRVYFDSGYPATEPNQLLGTFIYSASWSGVDDTFALNGTMTEPCSIRFEEVDYDSRATGAWAITFANDRLSGVRTDASGAREVVTLRPSAEVDCSGTGPWRAFRSDQWPITFSYPSSWRLSEHDYGFGGEHKFGIQLTCPDPARLSSGGFSITLVRGTGFKPFETETGRKGERVNIRFFRARPGPWMVGDEECVEATATDLPFRCAFARTAQRFGMTVLQGSVGEHRLYRPGGGYVGQGPGILRYAFLLDDEWVTLDSEDPPAWDLDDKPGPARFDGDGVTERIVRSIRPR